MILSDESPKGARDVADRTVEILDYQIEQERFGFLPSTSGPYSDPLECIDLPAITRLDQDEP